MLRGLQSRSRKRKRVSPAERCFLSVPLVMAPPARTARVSVLNHSGVTVDKRGQALHGGCDFPKRESSIHHGCGRISLKVPFWECSCRTRYRGERGGVGFNT